MNPDFNDLLRCFNDSGVEYLVVGGYAVIEYTEPRYTKDLDVWVRADKSNAAVVFAALRQFGAPLDEVTPEDFAQEGYVYQIGVSPVRIDILMSIEGVTFDEAWPNRRTVDFGGLTGWLISLDDLIRAKRAAGRPQDLVDAENLSRAAASARKNIQQENGT
jgi:predicted nucleotidyltransferase